MSNTNCFDFDLSQIASIDAYKVSDVNIGIPVYSPQETTSTLIVNLSGQYRSAIPFEKESVSISDSSGKSVAGTLHTVKVSWEIKCKSDELYTMLARMRNTPHCLVIKSFGDIIRVIPTGVNGYDFTEEESDGKKKCTMVLRNGMGICRKL